MVNVHVDAVKVCERAFALVHKKYEQMFFVCEQQNAVHVEVCSVQQKAGFGWCSVQNN